jgi:hypothetical protein
MNIKSTTDKMLKGGGYQTPLESRLVGRIRARSVGRYQLSAFLRARDFPWANFLIIASALILIGIGLTRAFSRPDRYRGKISGSILSVFGLCMTGLFCDGVFALTKHLPASHGAPRAGEIAPDFKLADPKGMPVALSALIDSPFTPNGSPATAGGSDKTAATVRIFYRGYW